MDIIKKALAFEQMKSSFKTRNEKILASREVKELILGLNEIYKQDRNKEIMDLMKCLTEIKRNIEKRLKGRLTI